MLARETDEIAHDDDRQLILALNFSLGDEHRRIMASVIAKLKNKSRRAVENKTKTNATLVSQIRSDATPSNYRWCFSSLRRCCTRMEKWCWNRRRPATKNRLGGEIVDGVGTLRWRWPNGTFVLRLITRIDQCCAGLFAA